MAATGASAQLHCPVPAHPRLPMAYSARQTPSDARAQDQPCCAQPSAVVHNGRYRRSLALPTTAVYPQSPLLVAALGLAELLGERGDLDEAEQILRAGADTSNGFAAWALADLLARRIGQDGSIVTGTPIPAEPLL